VSAPLIEAWIDTVIIVAFFLGCATIPALEALQDWHRRHTADRRELEWSELQEWARSVAQQHTTRDRVPGLVGDALNPSRMATSHTAGSETPGGVARRNTPGGVSDGKEPEAPDPSE
jgi:hypothetical protein